MPSAISCVILLMAAIAYWMLQLFIIRSQSQNSIFRKAVGRDWKGKMSPVLYAIAIGCAFWLPWISVGIYVLAALIWLVPDQRIERVLVNHES